MRNTSPVEAAEQTALFRWAAYSTGRYPELATLFHIPNGGSRDYREAHNLRLQGVKRGVPDIFLPAARKGFHGLFIELKRTKGGKVSEDQRAWLDALTRQGYRAVVCYGFEEAQHEIESYLD